MARLAEAISDRYRIEREIGVGGMATVHLARDLRHDRDVAIKVLHPDLAAALGADRFLAEIRTTAKLQHPHILPLLDSGGSEGAVFYVMPLVTGESLRQRLARERQLPVDDAVRIAREVASALDYAHRQGVVHRDVKPENILLQDGSALVADFGIALAVQSAGGQRMTQTGLSLGTPQYMSPEQAMGERSIDARSDIYSLAAMTYEMLTGEPPFTGATVQAIVAKVISAEPQPLAMVRKNVSPAIISTVHRGLEKLPADRFSTAAEFASALTATTSSTWAPAAERERVRGVAPNRLRAGLPWAAAAVVGIAAFALGRAFPAPERDGITGPVIATLLPDDGDDWAGSGVHFALSNDGRHVAMVSRREREPGLVVRSLDSLGTRRLGNTDGAVHPFWSPDGRALGFFADNQLKTVDLATGAVRALCPAARTAGASWGADNIIIYVPERGVGLHRVLASGGSCEKLDVAAPPSALDGRPRFLGDGRHFVATTDLGAWLGAVDGDSLTKLTDLARMRAVVAGPDWLLFRPPGSPSRSIFAQQIDVRARRLIGEPAQVLDNVPNPGGNTALAASNNGVLVARLSDEAEGRLLGMFERRGSLRDTSVIAQVGRTFGPHSLSRDGRRLALGGWRIAVLDLARNVTTDAVAPTSQPLQFPTWSPRDTAIAFVTADSGRSMLQVVDTRSSSVRTVATFPRGRIVERLAWSSDGRYIAFQYLPGGGSAWTEAWLHDLSENRSRRIFEEAAHVTVPQIAPHGRLIAYQGGSAGTGTAIFVRPFPGPGTAVRVSSGEGVEPRWSADGSELFYYDESAGVMGVTISPDASNLSSPKVAISATVFRTVAPTFGGTFLYDPTPDGRSFWGTVTRPRPINLTVVIDWWKLLPPAQRP